MSQNITRLFLLLWALPLNVLAANPTETPYPFDKPAFIEQARQAGIEHRYEGPWEFFVGGGAAAFDCNQDRFADVFIAGGTNTAQLFINTSRPAGELRFEAKALNLPESLLKKVTGAYPININNDAHTDLIILRVGKNIILKGEGDCNFSQWNKGLKFDGGREWSTAFAATWEKDETFPTLAFGHYVDRQAPGSPWGTCHDNTLLRADENGFYAEPFALNPSYCTLSLLFTDWNKSGQASLRVSNDRQYYREGKEQLWQIAPRKLPRQYTSSQGWERLQIWGMGIAQADLNADGFPEYALSSMGDTKLQILDDEQEEGRPVYRDGAYERGATAHRPYVGDDSKPSTGWHTQFADFNNDARQDLFIAKGNVEAMADFAKYDPDNLLLAGMNNQFVEQGAASGIALDTHGRGAIVEDFNADGMLDLLVVNRKHNINLFRNLGSQTEWGHRPMGNWLKVELDNGDINPMGIGATISVKTGNLSQNKTLSIGGGHASGQVGFTHFGLGVAERATIRVQWPDGDWSHPYKVFANHHIVIKREAALPAYWYAIDSSPP